MNYLNYKEIEYLCLSFQPVEKARLLKKYLIDYDNTDDIFILVSILINDSYNLLTDNDKELLHIKYKENIEKIFSSIEINSYLSILIYYLKKDDNIVLIVDNDINKEVVEKEIKVEKNIELVVKKQVNQSVAVSKTNIYKKFIDNMLIVDTTITKNRIYKDDMLSAFITYSGLEVDNRTFVKSLRDEGLVYDSSERINGGNRGLWKYVSFIQNTKVEELDDEDDDSIVDDDVETVESTTVDKTSVESDSYGNIIKPEENKDEYKRDYNIKKFKKEIIDFLPDLDSIDDRCITKSTKSLFK